MVIFLSITLNMCCGCSKDMSHWDGCPQHMFWLKNKKIKIHLRTLIWGTGSNQPAEQPTLTIIREYFASGMFGYDTFQVVNNKLLLRLHRCAGIHLLCQNATKSGLHAEAHIMSSSYFTLSRYPYFQFHEPSLCILMEFHYCMIKILSYFLILTNDMILF